ncbi:PEP-CTERM sorting domain-containing protein [Chromatium okenii]|uniref:PEP-CTERM sorting domain-containing protein n=1 Tax=Chromatium okenii TaxID=61644 RepID=UPI0019044A1B|nr:PEP-CTERM sorting domain-containing protein [Chromatium okenii]
MSKSASIVIITTAVLFSEVALANQMYLNLGALVDGGSYDVHIAFNPFPSVVLGDDDTTTGIFDEFGFSQILAPSIYDMSDGSLFGNFIDTNATSTLNAYGIPTSGTALDGTTNVSLTLPNCASGQCDLDELNGLAMGDDEGFGTSWDLQVVYRFDGVMSQSGAVFTSGYLDVYFNDTRNDSFSGGVRTSVNYGGVNEQVLFRGELNGSDINLGNLDVFFEITSAIDNFLWVSDGQGYYHDAHDLALTGDFAKLTLDTNIDPPIPTPEQLLLRTVALTTPDAPYSVVAIRESHLDGSVKVEVPEPSTLALMGIGLLFGSRRKKI